jgi:hypothetical protein
VTLHFRVSTGVNLAVTLAAHQILDVGIL